jgi:hypothetical protein
MVETISLDFSLQLDKSKILKLDENYYSEHLVKIFRHLS